jgi:hypothetical protein
MKWLANAVKKFLNYDDPKLTPFSVRAATALLLEATIVVSYTAFLRHLSLLHWLVALSIVWGVFAALMRYWERFASDQDLRGVSKLIVKIGSTTKLSTWDNISVIALAHLSFIMAFLISAGAVQTAIHYPSQLKLPLWLSLVCIWVIYFPYPPIFAYAVNKMGLCLCSRWAARLQGDTSNAEIKRILNRMSYALTVVVAVPPLLTVLF